MITKFHYDPLKGHNNTKGDNPDFKKNTCQLFFDEESIYEISKQYLNKFCNGYTDGRADKPKAICPFNFSKVGGIKNNNKNSRMQNYPGCKDTQIHTQNTLIIIRNPFKTLQSSIIVNLINLLGCPSSVYKTYL